MGAVWSGSFGKPSLTGTCLFILYLFNVVVTKINSLKAQNLENMSKTKEEANGNPSPTSYFV